MKPVDQLVLHEPNKGLYGDCQRACIASLLEMNPIDVPHFLEAGDTLSFWESLNSFLATKGFFLLQTSCFAFDGDLHKNSAPCYHMIYGKTERGTEHAVVAVNGEIVHDPHPSKSGLLKEDKDNWTFGFLVAANIARCSYTGEG